MEEELILRAFLHEKKGVSKRLLAAVKYRGGALAVNGQAVTVRHQLQIGDEVTLKLPPENQSELILPENIDLQICYEDLDLLIINKPAQMATMPSMNHPRQTLANAVLFYYKETGTEATFHAVNRLDRGTSGLLIIAKHRYAHDLLSQAQQTGRLTRTYQALVAGTLMDEGIFNAPIGRKPTSIIERMVREDGKKAVTLYKSLASSEGYSLVELSLKTGRTHQIRVHLSGAGFPLLGDELYGGDRSLLDHQALHCNRVKLQHPFTNEPLVIECKSPSSWTPIIRRMNLT
nr:RluA family pseudouridine synthase [Shouchella xiaoxiensis]